MKGTQVVQSAVLARQLEDWACAVRSGSPIRVAKSAVRVPKRVTLTTEIESVGSGTELEVKVKWLDRAVETIPLVGVLVGSPSDLGVVAPAREVLASLGVPAELRVLSAHRTPDLTVEYVRTAESKGIEVIIACAGMAAHLAGTVAAYTLLPVIGVPLSSGVLDGLDSLLATAQMPPGVPVATVAVDGVKNAAFLAARILSLKYPAVRERLAEAMNAERRKYAQAAARAERVDSQTCPALSCERESKRRKTKQRGRR